MTVPDLDSAPVKAITRFAECQPALVSCAGVVTQGEAFVAVVDRVAAAAESLAEGACPVYWFNPVARGGPMSRRRIGLTLPPGMRGREQAWAAQARNMA